MLPSAVVLPPLRHHPLSARHHPQVDHAVRRALVRRLEELDEVRGDALEPRGGRRRLLRVQHLDRFHHLPRRSLENVPQERPDV